MLSTSNDEESVDAGLDFLKRSERNIEIFEIEKGETTASKIARQEKVIHRGDQIIGDSNSHSLKYPEEPHKYATVSIKFTVSNVFSVFQFKSVIKEERRE